ncbi:MAG: FtsX-like permease family protein [Anaerolineae bacterium]|jgi:putative ABC transport system permease protein|nr:FtsX-like permease family protein [Anaerolineae bacterium]
MITPRWKKVLADLWGNKVRTLLAALSIGVGVFAVGVIASAYVIVQRDMESDYETANPHTARIYCEDFGAELAAELASVPGVTAIEARYHQWIKATGVDGMQYPIDVDSMVSVDQFSVDRLAFQNGARDLRDGEIILERQGAEGLGLQVGDAVDLLLNDGQVRTLTVVGTVHDVIANPFKFASSTSGYVTPDTMALLGGSSLYNYLTLITDGSPTDTAHVRAVAEQVATEIKARGILVYNVSVNNPGKHPADATISTVLMLMGALAVMAVLLSAFLVTNTASSVMGQQIRQIGAMKAVGATAGQMLGMYSVLLLTYGLVALAFAVPLGALAALGLTRWLVMMLNATPSAFSVPPIALALQVFVGLVVPLVGGIIPVIGGARRTVRQAISDYGLSTATRSNWFDRLLEATHLPRPLMLSLRNAFRRKGRLILTVATLVLAGAIFIAVVSVRKSLHLEIAQNLAYYQSDVNVDFVQPYALDPLLDITREVPGIVAAEGWATRKANVIRADGINSDQVLLYAPPSGSRLVTPTMVEGRWLLPTDENAIVVDNHFLDARPDVKVGDIIQVLIGTQTFPFQVVGSFRVGSNVPSPFTYTNAEYLTRITGTEGLVTGMRVVVESPTASRQEEVLRALQTHFQSQDIRASMQTGEAFAAQQRSRVDLLIVLLLLMALLIATVGGLGLMGTMSMNVLERTREIGVMRSIGAENGAIFQLVVAEGLVIGLLSWAAGLVVAIPITHLLDRALGSRLLTVPLVYTYSAGGVLIWLAIVLVVATVASLLPARNAVRLTVRDVLAYE